MSFKFSIDLKFESFHSPVTKKWFFFFSLFKALMMRRPTGKSKRSPLMESVKTLTRYFKAKLCAGTLSYLIWAFISSILLCGKNIVLFFTPETFQFAIGSWTAQVHARWKPRPCPLSRGLLWGQVLRIDQDSWCCQMWKIFSIQLLQARSIWIPGRMFFI